MMHKLSGRVLDMSHPPHCFVQALSAHVKFCFYLPRAHMLGATVMHSWRHELSASKGVLECTAMLTDQRTHEISGGSPSRTFCTKKALYMPKPHEGKNAEWRNAHIELRWLPLAFQSDRMPRVI